MAGLVGVCRYNGLVGIFPIDFAASCHPVMNLRDLDEGLRAGHVWPVAIAEPFHLSDRVLMFPLQNRIFQFQPLLVLLGQRHRRRGFRVGDR